ncbi:PREDICTED: bark storage protein A-like isoform X2 [Ipomoea nil]|uniref:bark storage protein A-like isoform X2 n=1 Tax=Ipomoea nil TaxID=35883 RepID=UPI000900D436|nr:PREDICTED: bark storage protein A-like isoform X2 [Ipomoea nil]
MAAHNHYTLHLPLTLASILVLLFTAVSAIPNKSLRSIVKELNEEGPYLGLITVYPPEENAFFSTNSFKPHPTHPYVDLSGRRFRAGKVEGKKVIYVKCGIGMVNAAAATQQMLDLFDVTGVVHFGIAGNANGSLSIGDVTIPRQLVQTGLWDWLNPNSTLPASDAAVLEIERYNVPEGGSNRLGRIGYNTEQNPSNAQRTIWFNTSKHWLRLASNLPGVKLERCVNSSLCLSQQPKLLVGLKGSTSNIFIDNAAYREFLFQTFGISSVDMESAAVVEANDRVEWFSGDSYSWIVGLGRSSEGTERDWLVRTSSSSKYCQCG